MLVSLAVGLVLGLTQTEFVRPVRTERSPTEQWRAPRVQTEKPHLLTTGAVEIRVRQVKGR